MKIGIIGSGRVGATLGKRFADAGHEVIFGSRTPDSKDVQDTVADAPNSRSALLPETVEASELLLLATPWPATEQVLTSLGDLGNRILIDVTNPVSPDLKGLTVDNNTSAGEQVARWARNARVVKAFNTIGAPVMANPQFPEGNALLLLCGDNVAARQVVRELATQIGFDAQEFGDITRSRVLEYFALLWITLAVGEGRGPNMAFRLIQR